MTRPVELGPNPTVLGEHYCGGPLRQYADQGSVADVPGHTVVQCTACGELVVLGEREQVAADTDAWWRQ